MGLACLCRGAGRYQGEKFPRLIGQVLTPLTMMEQQLRKYDKVSLLKRAVLVANGAARHAARKYRKK